MRAGVSHNSKRSEGASIVALLAVFALLIQALLPSAAMAAQTAGGAGATVVICTQFGVQALTPDHQPAPHKGFAGLPCQNCLAAAHAATLTPDLASLPAPYFVAYVRHTPAERAAPQVARAPPRPLGQGPPSLSA